jgi:hypothetical protein
VILRTRRREAGPDGPFPRTAGFVTETPDACREEFFRPLFKGVRLAMLQLRRLQHGRVHLYVLYIALTVLVLLAWNL